MKKKQSDMPIMRQEMSTEWKWRLRVQMWVMIACVLCVAGIEVFSGIARHKVRRDMELLESCHTELLESHRKLLVHHLELVESHRELQDIIDPPVKDDEL